MENSSLISIIVPVYNKANELSLCLNSILDQSYVNIELILIDDGSTDESPIICDNYSHSDSRIIVKHIKNRGVSNARNLGIRIANGQYIQFIDADDYIASNMVEVLHDKMRKFECDMVFCGYFQVENCNIKGYVAPKLEGIITPKEYFQIVDSNHLDPLCGSPCTRLFKSSIIKNNHLEFKQNITFAEDFRFVIDYVIKCKTIYAIDESFYYYNLDIPFSLTKTTRLSVNDAWAQQLDFIHFLGNLTQSEKYSIYFPHLIENIYFELIVLSLFSRIKYRKNNYIDVIAWLNVSFRPNFNFDIKNIRCEKYHDKNDYNYRRKNQLYIFSKIFLFACKIGFMKLFIFSLFLFRFLIMLLYDKSR